MSGDKNTTDGQPQGGQPQNNQPQGGQPQGDQPRGGQPQSGQAYGQTQQPVQQGPGLADRLQSPPTVNHIKSVVAIYALIGLGMGLIAFLIGAVDEALISTPDSADFGSALGGAMYVAGGYGIPVSGIPYVGAVVSAGVGIRFSDRIGEDLQTVATAAAVASFLGVIVMWLIAAILGSTQFDGVDLEFGGLLINSIIAGIGLGMISAGMVYIERNLTPE